MVGTRKELLEEINKLVVGEAHLNVYFTIKDILNGKKNLGEYKEFKRKIKMRYKIRKLYNAIEDWLYVVQKCEREKCM